MFSFSKARDLFKLQRQAKQVRKELKKIHVEAQSQGVKVVVSGDQKVVSIEIGVGIPREKMPALLTDALNRALAKAQVVSAEKMQGVMGDFGLTTGE